MTTLLMYTSEVSQEIKERAEAIATHVPGYSRTNAPSPENSLEEMDDIRSRILACDDIQLFTNQPSDAPPLLFLIGVAQSANKALHISTSLHQDSDRPIDDKCLCSGGQPIRWGPQHLAKSRETATTANLNKRQA